PGARGARVIDEKRELASVVRSGAGIRRGPADDQMPSLGGVLQQLRQQLQDGLLLTQVRGQARELRDQRSPVAIVREPIQASVDDRAELGARGLAIAELEMGACAGELPGHELRD